MCKRDEVGRAYTRQMIRDGDGIHWDEAGGASEAMIVSAIHRN